MCFLSKLGLGVEASSKNGGTIMEEKDD
ncbi:uncharacterized protein G2W53_035613 [Senna tora]|uniref:Uncharacterized protein n=1 Tax=Senna tora TaxID=362788 RepID=A0A834SQR5_9FABA|nr:uncharacterized protein G2W53_035613 [Senna tora]